MIRRLFVGAVLAVGILIPAASTSAQAQTQTPQTPAPAGGSIGIGLLEAPVSRENDPRAKIYIVDHLAPATTISRRIKITNGTTTARTISLYSGAASIDSGEFVTADGHGGNDLAGWTSISPSSISVPAGQSAEATVTIAIPSGVGDGERYGVVWAEVATPNTVGVTVVNRVGIRMYLSVGVGVEPKSDFTIDTLTAKRLSTGEPAVSAMVHNTGGRALDMAGKLELKNGPGGLTAGPFTAELGTTLGLNQTEPVLVKLDKRIPAGPWEAVITLNSGQLVRAAKATITFPKTNGTSGRPVKASALDKAKQILLPLAGLALAVGVALLIILWRRRRRDEESADVEADLRRFERMLQQQRAGTLDTSAEDPELAIKAAIKQAGRAGHKDTEQKLKEKLDEYRTHRDAAAASAQPVAVGAEAAPAIAAAAVIVEDAPPAPSLPAPPDMAEILAGVTTEPAQQPTRWSDLVDDMNIRERGDAPDDGDVGAEAPAVESDLARAVRLAAEQARKAAEEAASKGH